MVYVGHGLNIAHKFNIYFNSGVEDNSDIANHINNGTYFRQDLTFYTDDAYLWRANYEQLVEIEPNLYFSYEDPSKGSLTYGANIDNSDPYQFIDKREEK